MSITEIIDDMTREMVGSDGFERHMQPPLSHHNQAYVQRDYKTGELFVMCPYCGKKNLKIRDDTQISNLELKCKGSGCKSTFLVNIKGGNKVG